MFTPVVIALLSLVLSCNALTVGQTANKDANCRAAAKNPVKCNRQYQPVCAKLAGQHVTGSNVCDFCKRYGNTAAFIFQIGTTATGQFYCQELRVGDFNYKDPECRYLVNRTGCTRKSKPYCATTNNFKTYISGSNKCDYCSKYGSVDALIVNIGQLADSSAQCAPFQLGTRATDDLGCKYLANRAQKICTFELNQVCGQLSNGTAVQGGSKCDFCSRFGNTDAEVTQC